MWINELISMPFSHANEIILYIIRVVNKITVIFTSVSAILVTIFKVCINFLEHI